MNATQSTTLINRVRRRDIEALAQYIQEQRFHLRCFLSSITGRHLLGVLDIDDLVQDVSAAALAGLKTAPLDKYEPLQWLRQLARRRVIDAHRFHFDAQRRAVGRQVSIQGPANQRSPVGGLEQILAASITSPSAALSRADRLDQLREAVAGLSAEQQHAIRLRYVERMATKQIAGQLGKTDVAIRVMLSRAIRRLETTLKDVKPTR